MDDRKEVYKLALEHALNKIEKNMDVLKDSFPFVTIHDKWELCKEEDWDLNIFKDGYWCNGFWIGMLWLAYKLTKKDKFKKRAYELCRLIEPRKKSNKIHDLGFLFYPSFCVGYEVVKDEYLKSVGLTAADSLLSRFNDKIGAITVSGDPDKSGLIAIDTMMNLPLLSNYYVVKCPTDYVPYWDFNDPDIPNTVRDSSAAAITASGLSDSFKFSEENKFGDIALNILNSLCKGYLAEEEVEGILKHGCFNKPEGKGVDESLIWGDYYFMDVIIKLLGGE